MNPSQLVLDQVRAMGLRLRDARLARDINPRDLETELRTTYRHLLAIEEGQMRLFYSDSFFCDLFARYAIQLGFSAEQAQDMRLALHGEGPLIEQVESVEPKTTGDEASEAPHEEPVTEAVAQAQMELEPSTGTPVHNDIPSVVETIDSQSHAAPAPIQEGPPPQVDDSKTDPPVNSSGSPASLGSLWFWGAIAVGLVLAMVILTLDPAAEPPRALSAVTTPKPQVTSPPSSGTDPSRASGESTLPEKPRETAKSQEIQTQASDAQLPSGSSAAPGSAGMADSTAGSAQQEATATPAPEPPRERRVSETILVSAFDAPASFSSGAAMSIRFNVKGWVWVREFDDNVREFVVQPGQTVRFDDMPIFIVVPFPDQLTVRVGNQPVTLRRNDDEKNHARYSRSMLRGLVTNP